MSGPLHVLSLFAGIGGLDLGLQRAGMRIVGQVELDLSCRHILARHWPEVDRHDDIATAIAWWTSRARPAVHLVAGGFPCQPVSSAGRRQGTADPRWLWPAMAEVIAAVRPQWVLAENVPGLRTRGLAAVLDDLTRLGYRTRTLVASACAFGAPPTRTRLLVLAHTVGLRREPRRAAPVGAAPPPRRKTAQPTAQRGHWWTHEPPLDRVAYGLPGRVDRIRALGNAVIPQLAEHLGRLIIAAHSAPPEHDGRSVP